MEKLTEKKKPFFRFLSWSSKIFYKKRKFVGLENIPDSPCVFVGNHAQAHGPFSCQLFFPFPKKIWTFHKVMNIKDFPEYALSDFFPNHTKKNRWFYKSLTTLTAPLGSYIFKNADTIPVFKDTRAIQTFNKTIAALEDGYSIIIFPEHREPFNEIINNFQDKFVDTARFYLKKTNKQLSFVPMYNSPSLKTIVFGKPIEFDPNSKIENERKRICDYIKSEITFIAKNLPEHKVTPYARTKKKNFPMSK